MDQQAREQALSAPCPRWKRTPSVKKSSALRPVNPPHSPMPSSREASKSIKRRRHCRKCRPPAGRGRREFPWLGRLWRPAVQRLTNTLVQSRIYAQRKQDVFRSLGMK
jgi:hypothetical protein